MGFSHSDTDLIMNSLICLWDEGAYQEEVENELYELGFNENNTLYIIAAFERSKVDIESEA